MTLKTLVPLGDQAVLATCVEETAALCLSTAVRRAAPAWLVDVVHAYTSVAIFFDLEQIVFAQVSAFLRDQILPSCPTEVELQPRHHRIPCCYELGSDWPRVTELTRLSVEEVIQRHLAMEYTVYAIGFCPGFPYLGYLPQELWVPRKEQPSLRVEAGSVGLAARQTGIYTEPRPGGWNVIGRTPLELVNVADGYFPLRTGDRVRFERIDEAEFHRRFGQRL